MARFELAEGEEVVDQTIGHMNVDGVMRPARLILTSRRVLAIADSKPPWWMPGGLAKLLARTTDKIRTQIQRDEFASVEHTGTRGLKLRNHGEGYGLVWFEIDVLMERDAWVTRLDNWRDTRD